MSIKDGHRPGPAPLRRLQLNVDVACMDKEDIAVLRARLDDFVALLVREFDKARCGIKDF